MDIQTDVCIVGGGPAGILLGFLLARNGVSTVILERTSLKERNFRGEHINHETEWLLKQYNLFEKMENIGLLRMKKVEFFNGSEKVKTIVPGPLEDHVGIHIPQSHLLTSIIKESQSFHDYKLILNATVKDLIKDENGFYSGVRASKGGADITVKSSVVIGADGRYSTIRKLAEIPVTIRKHGYDVLWAKIPAPKGWEPTTRMALVDGHQLALFTQTGGNIQIGWNIEEGSFPNLIKGSFEPFLIPLIETFPKLAEIAKQYLKSWKDFVCLKVHSSLCETWVKDGLVLMGDAAHTMTPTGAIGINCAMKDAHILAPVLIEAIQEKDPSARFLKKFEIERRHEIEEQQKMQVKEELTYIDNFVHSVIPS